MKVNSRAHTFMSAWFVGSVSAPPAHTNELIVRIGKPGWSHKMVMLSVRGENWWPSIPTLCWVSMVNIEHWCLNKLRWEYVRESPCSCSRNLNRSVVSLFYSGGKAITRTHKVGIGFRAYTVQCVPKWTIFRKRRHQWSSLGVLRSTGLFSANVHIKQLSARMQKQAARTGSPVCK